MGRNLFQLIDFDRTLFDTQKFVQAMTTEIGNTEPGVGAELEAEYEAAYAKEETFFLLRYLRETHGDEWFQSLVERVVRRIGAASLLMASAENRLALADTVTDCRPAWGIITYGDSIDQRLKARIVGLQDAPMLIGHTPDKAQLLSSWQNPNDGTFRLPEVFGGGMVEELTLEDDKLRAFKGLPAGVRGFWITDKPNAAQLLAGDSSIPASAVIGVKGLAEVMQHLRPDVPSTPYV